MRKGSISFYDWGKPDSIATHISSKYHEWQGYKEGAMTRWEEIEAYIYATDTLSLPGGAVFDHTTHVPIIHEIRDDLISIMYSTILPHEDFLGWQAYDKDSATKDKRSKATAYLKNRHSLNGFRKTMDKLISDSIDYGNAFCQVQHVDNRKVRSDGTVSEGYVGPVIKRFSPYDVVFDPTACSFEQSPKILRTLVTMGEFIQMAKANDWDQETVDHIVEKRGTYGSVAFSDNKKNKQYSPEGFGTIEQYYASGMVELLWFYGDVFDEYEGELRPDRCAIVADRMNLLDEYDCPDPKIYHFGWKTKPDNLWAQGALDQLLGINFQVNHRENALSTSIDRFIYPDKEIVGDAEEIYDPETGSTRWLVPEGGGVRDIVPDATVLSYDNQIEKLKIQARMAVGLPPTLQGFRTPGEKTAFEVQTLNDGAFRAFIHKAERFELYLLEPAVNAELVLGRENLNSPLQVQDETEDGIMTFIQITQSDLRSNGKLVPYGARRFAHYNKQMQTINMLANSNLGQLIAPHMNTFNLAGVVEHLGSLGEFKLFDKFAQIEEQFEQQQLVNTAQQMNQQELSQPTPEEMMLESES